MTLLQHALEYARRGWPVFPCDPTTKKPLTRHGLKDATIDASTIRRWWGQFPDAMIAVTTGGKSGFWALDLDLDSEKGHDGIATLAALGTLPETITQTTPRGGVHSFFKWDSARPVKNSVSKVGPGIDVRGAGGYVIMAGSLRADGRAYQWRNPPDRFVLADAPPWLYEAISRAQPEPDSRSKDETLNASSSPDGTAAQILERACQRVASTASGKRNDALNRASFALGRLIGQGSLQREAVEDALLEAALACGLVDDDGEDSAKATIASGLGAGIRESREFTERWFEPFEDPQSEAETNASASDNDDGAKDADAEAKDDDAEATEDFEATFSRLAALSGFEYDRVRAAEAQRLGVRVATLDAEVEKRRSVKEENTGSGRLLSLPIPEPWATPVEGAELLDALTVAIASYVKLSDAAAMAVALWCVHAHAFEASPISPRLAITSPEKRCGKTTLLRVIQELVPKPLQAANITAAALFRTVEAARPTLLIDEADTFLAENEELRGIINSGHARDGQVVRLVGEDHEPRAFSTCCPTAIAAIGAIPATIEDRSVDIALRRRRKDEPVARFRIGRTGELQVLCRKAARWVADNLEPLRELDPPLPEELHDRAADNWRPLVAIADHAGAEWPAKGRRAALELSGANAAEADTMHTLLLSDIRDQFSAQKVDRLTSEDLTGALSSMAERPWPTFDRGRAITPATVAKMLKPYGIAPGTIRTDERTKKGYYLSAFEDAFARYLPPEAVTPSHP